MSQAAASAPAPVVPFNAPTQNPNQPISHGADFGAGPDSSSLGLGSQDVQGNANFQAALASYMPVLLHIASRPNTSPETRNVIRQLRDSL
jgi:hypothetical protein